MITAIMFGIFLIFLGVGVPIAASVGWATLSVNLLDPSFACDAIYFVKTMANGMDSYVLLAVPLFMLSSSIMAESGLSGRLFNVFSYFFGNLPAGLPIAVVITCLFYGAICGSGPATVAAIGTMCIPLLTKLGYDKDKDFVTSMIAVAGGLGVIIPPSIPFITYGLCTGASIGDLFIAGFMPGLLIGLFIVFYVIYYFARHDNSNLCIEAYTQELRSKGFLRILKEGFWALLAPVIILGGIYGGIVSPTEAAGVSVVYALLIGVVAYREINFKKFIKCLVDTGHTATPVMLILGICIVFGRVLSMLRIPQTLATFVTSNIESKIAVLLAINLFLLVAGMLMDTIPCILILAPIFLPIVQAYNVDIVHFGILITKIPITRIAKHAVPFLAMFLVALLVITFVPSVSLWLPSVLSK